MEKRTEASGSNKRPRLKKERESAPAVPESRGEWFCRERRLVHKRDKAGRQMAAEHGTSGPRGVEDQAGRASISLDGDDDDNRTTREASQSPDGVD